MSKYDKPKFEEIELGQNPFVANLKIKVTTMKSDDKYKQVEDVWMRTDIELEAMPYCRIFSDSDRRLKMAKLSPRSKDLLLWIMYEVKRSKDWLWLNKTRYMEENNISSINTYKSALKELIKANYIQHTIFMDVYWINPDLFFNGNRITNFPNNIIKR